MVRLNDPSASQDVAPRRRKRLLPLAVAASVLLALTGSLLLLLMLCREPLRRMAVQELQRRTSAQLQVKGFVQVSLFRYFPFASISLGQVELWKNGFDGFPLITCDQFSLLFLPLDLITGRIDVHRLRFVNARILLLRQSDGKTNYDLFASSPNDDSPRLVLDVWQARFSHSELVFADSVRRLCVEVSVPTLRLNGQFPEDSLNLSLDGAIADVRVHSRQQRYHWQQPISFSSQMVYDVQSRQASMQSTALQLGRVSLKMEGIFSLHPERNAYDLQIAGSGIRLGDLLALSPLEPSVRSRIQRASGSVDGSARISSSNGPPVVQAAAELQNGTLMLRNPQYSIKQLHLKAAYRSEGSNKAFDQLQVSSFRWVSNGQECSGNAVLTNLKMPRLSATLRGHLDLSLLAALFPDNHQLPESGWARTDSLRLQARLTENWLPQRPEDISVRGQLSLDRMAWKAGSDPLVVEHANLMLHNNTLWLQQATCRWGRSDAAISGSLTPLAPLVWSFIRKQAAPAATLQMKLQSRHMDFSARSGAEKMPMDSSLALLQQITDRISGAVECSVDRFSWRQIRLDQLRMQVQLSPEGIALQEVSCRHAGGTVQAEAHLRPASNGDAYVSVQAHASDLNISELFRQFENFNQNYLTADQLNGTARAVLNLSGRWMKGRWDPSALEAQTTVTIERGELKNWAPLEELSRFIKLEELRHVRFRTLHNTLTLRDRKVIVPEMDVICNALNIHAGGTYAFDHTVNYRIQLNLLRLLTDRLRRLDYDADAGEETTTGALNLYLTMTGPALDPVVRYDKERVKQKIATDLQREKEQLRTLLRGEFAPASPHTQPSLDEPAYEFFEFAGPDSTDY
ncbi:MAG: AsmA-like C-terminal region-containing protein [Chitinophagales bacterium]|nr:AsmA-like C-terminal region-containing protein [Chitinophagales bacterium]